MNETQPDLPAVLTPEGKPPYLTLGLVLVTMNQNHGGLTIADIAFALTALGFSHNGHDYSHIQPIDLYGTVLEAKKTK